MTLIITRTSHLSSVSVKANIRVVNVMSGLNRLCAGAANHDA